MLFYARFFNVYYKIEKTLFSCKKIKATTSVCCQMLFYCSLPSFVFSTNLCTLILPYFFACSNLSLFAVISIKDLSYAIIGEWKDTNLHICNFLSFFKYKLIL